MERYGSQKNSGWLLWFLRGALVLGLFIMVGRLIELQVIKGDYFRGLSEGNRVRRVPIVAKRGNILSRGGEILVGSTEVRKRIVFDPASGYEKINDLEGAKDEEIISEWIRDYVLGNKFAHVGGYLGEVNEDEVEKIDSACSYLGVKTLGALTGRSGLEEQYDCTLTGVDGEELVEVDTSGERVRTLGRRSPVAGSDLVTNIHFDLQKRIAEIMDENEMNGAVIATDGNGEILALYSKPSFDPNIFVKGNEKIINSLLKDSQLPFFNRVIGGKFHPGSVYKPLIALAALEEGKIDEDYRYVDTGEIEVKTLYGDFSYTNWYFTQYGGVEGEIDLTRAIARSTDTFFYKLGELLGIDNMVKWSEKFGLGEKSAIDISGAVSGLVPTPKWKEEVKGEKWFLGNTYHMAIGQGDIALAPLEINTMISAIANNGSICTPKLFGKPSCDQIKVDSKNIELVKQGMVDVCQTGGTAFTFFDFPKTEAGDSLVACKTGTAETGIEEVNHAWFVAFAPVAFPEIVVTVLVEKGGEGSRVAGPIAREIFDYWFKELK